MHATQHNQVGTVVATNMTNQRTRSKVVLITILALFGGMVLWYVTIRARAANRERAFIDAVRTNDTPLVLSMLKAGADPNSRDRPIHGLFELQDLFHARTTPVTYNTALLVAMGWHDNKLSTFTVVSEALPIVKALLDSGADINARDIHGDTAVIIAAWTGKHDTLKLLLDRGADRKAIDKDGKYAWYFSYILGDPKSLSILLEHGANVDQMAPGGNCALVWNAIQGRADIVKLLISHHVNVNIRDEAGHGALYWARQYHKTKMVAMLEREGAME